MVSFLRDNARWLSAGALMTFLSSFGQTFFISIFSGEIRTTFELSHGEWGGIYTLGTALSACVMLAAGGLTDRYRSRALGAVILALLAGACLAMALNPWAAMLPFVIFALRFTGQGMMSHIAIVSMSRWFVATRGRALSIATLGFSVGEAILPVTFVALMTVMDWRLLWVIATGVALLAIAPLIRLLQSERTPQSHAAEGGAAGMGGEHWTRRGVLRHWLFWLMVPALLGPPAFNTAFFFQQVPYAMAKGWAHISLVALYPLYTAVGVAAMLASGWLLDRFGTARLLPWHQIPFVLAFALFASGDTLGVAALALVILGLGQGAFATIPAAFWAEFFGTRHLGSIKSMATALMVLGSAIGPGVSGVLMDRGVGIETQYGFIAGYFAVVSVIVAIGIPMAARRL